MEIVPASDRSLLVRAGDHERVVALAQALERARLPGVTSYSPAYTSVLVRYEPAAVDGDALETSLNELANSVGEHPAERRDIVLPVTFDGPDLPDLARAKGLRPADVIEIFCATEYRVYFLGFMPGFGYLGEVDGRITAPRHAAPRKMVPAGSVGIAGRQAGIYPMQTPGGWNLIGRCTIPMFIPDRHPPNFLRAGDRVRFEPA